MVSRRASGKVNGSFAVAGDRLANGRSDGLDLDVRRGEILGFVGGFRGTGKSVVLMRTIPGSTLRGGTVERCSATTSARSTRRPGRES